MPITPEGYFVQTSAEALETYRAKARALWGDDIDTETEGELIPGVVRLCADEEVRLQGEIAELCRALDPLTSTGVILEANGALANMTPIAARPSSASARATGTPGTDISLRTVRYTSNGSIWTTPENTVIGDDGMIDFTAESVEVGPVLAITSGPTAWEIQQPVSGWDTFALLDDATPGMLDETDAEFRARLDTAASPEATEWALKKAAFDLVGMPRARVLVNRGVVTDSNGLPLKSVEMILDGATDQEAAKLLYTKVTADSGFHGNRRVTWDGDAEIPADPDFVGYYSRPEFRRAQVKVTLYTSGAELPLPLGYEGIVQAAIGTKAARPATGIDLTSAAWAAAVMAVLPEGSVVNVEVSFRWKSTDGWSFPVLEVPLRERPYILAGPGPAWIEGTGIEPFDTTGDPVAPLQLRSGVGAFTTIDFDEGVHPLADVVAAINQAQVPGVSAASRGGRLVLRSIGVGPLASLEIGPSSGILLAALGMSTGIYTGTSTDVTVEVIP